MRGHLAIADGSYISMEKVTSLLKQSREKKNISLQEAEIATHIPVRYLQVLEGGEEGRLLADKMYLVPYLRTYATFLGLNPTTVVTQFVTELQGVQATEEAVRPQRAELVPASSRLSSLATPFLLLLALLGVFAVFSRQGADETPESLQARGDTPPALSPPPAESALVQAAPVESSLAEAAPAQSAPTAPPSAAEVVTASVTPPPSTSPSAIEMLPSPPVAAPIAPAPSLVLVAAQPEPPPSTATHLLKVRAKEKTWVRVTIDGQRQRDTTLEPGQQVEWSAEEGFMLTLGNAGGVALNLNGKDLSSPGKPGQVMRDLRLPPVSQTPPGASTVSVSSPRKRPLPQARAGGNNTDLKNILETLKELRQEIRG